MVLKVGDHVNVTGIVIKVENDCALVKLNNTDTEFWIKEEDIKSYRPMNEETK